MAAPMVERRAWTANRTIALIIGIVFTIIGLVGLFIAPSMAVKSLLGFDIDLVHSIFHLVTGLLGLIAAFTGWSRLFNQIFGVVYLIIGLAGLIYPGLYMRGMFLGMMHDNAADHVLHLVTGVIAAYVGYFVHDYYREREPMTATAERGRSSGMDRDQYGTDRPGYGEGRIDRGEGRIDRGEGRIDRGTDRTDRPGYGEGRIDRGTDRTDRPGL